MKLIAEAERPHPGVERDVFSEVSSENVAMAYVLMAPDSGAEPMESMQVLLRLSQPRRTDGGE